MKFARRILGRGYMEDQRSAFMWIESDDDPECAWLIAGGTISMSVELAWDMQRPSPCVLKIIAERIPNALTFAKGTPIDVLRYA